MYPPFRDFPFPQSTMTGSGRQGICQLGEGVKGVFWRWLKERPDDSSIPNWAWCITWTVMGSGVVLNLVLLLMKFQIIG